MTINLQSADLRYLLEQANILNDYTQLTSPIDPSGVREVSGANNNLVGGFQLNQTNQTLEWTGGYDPLTGLTSGDNVNSWDWGKADTDFLPLFFEDNPNGTVPKFGITYEYAKQIAVTDKNGVSPFSGTTFDPPTTWIPTFSADVMGSIVNNGLAPNVTFPEDGNTSPRTITQLITSSDVDPSSPTYNPAADAAMNNLGGEPVDVSNTVQGTTQTAAIPNPGILGGVPYNEFFVAFGQFFDHGLDFISKGGGYVLIPLSENDPLYDPVPNGNPMQNMMMLDRAKLSNEVGTFVLDSSQLGFHMEGGDYDVDANGNLVLKAGVTPTFNNNTGLMIDQSQTYGSHEAHNVLVREYDDMGNVTGRLIDGGEDGILTRVDADTGELVQINLNTGTANVLNPATLAVSGAYTTNALDFLTVPGSVEWPFGSGNFTDGDDELATWADMKFNAARIGIELIDTDVLDIPSIKADAVGRLMTPDVVAELNALNAAAGKSALDASIEFTPQNVATVGYGYRSDETLSDMLTRVGTVTMAELEAHDPFFRDADGNVVFSNQPMLADIAHGANPAAGAGNYSAELLAMHKVSGDGRVNENVGLTSVHHVFHEEHNIQAAQIMSQALTLALTDGDLTAINGAGAGAGWLTTNLVDFAGIPQNTTTYDLTTQTGRDAMLADTDAMAYAIENLAWDGEKVYQGARIITESEYNHIAIDQYVTGLYPALPEFVSYSADINLSVSLEFSQAVFRLGHSQLTETVQLSTPNATGNPGDPGYIPTSFTQEELFDAFLNPIMYDQYSAAGIVSGLQHQQGNEIDEFVTSALQQSLVGIPLDLPALNIARGRDVGLPTLNELRQQAFEGLMQNTPNNANGSGIAPYTSWADFGGSMRNPDSLVNFIAAYAVDDGSTGADWGIDEARAAYEAGTMSLQDLRGTAQSLLEAYAAGDADAVAFMEGGGTPVYAPNDPNAINGWVYSGGAGDQGFWDIDLWIGGLAEQPLFDGPLGTTFSLVMLDFAQRMQDGDRFYYLYRMPVGHHLGDQIIGEQFSDLIMRTTGLENIGDAFGKQSAYYYLDGTTTDNDRDGLYGTLAADGTSPGSADPNGIHDYFNAIYEVLPDATKNLVVANKSFEVDSLAQPTNSTNGFGTWVAGAPEGWDLRTHTGAVVGGGAGVVDPTTIAIPDTTPSDAQVAYLGKNRALTQDVGQPLVAGNSYLMTAEIGNRANTTNDFKVQFRLVNVDTGLVILASQVFDDTNDGGAGEQWVDNGTWKTLFWDTGPIPAGDDGANFRIEILNLSTAGAGQNELVLIDNVNLSTTEPGGGANDGHIVVAGYEGNDFIKGGLGDDYLYGNADNDVLEGAQGNDHLYGGDGNDWITDYENDDFIHGGAGNDYIAAGPGVLDTAHGGDGNDEVHGGDGIDEVFGDNGDDMLFGEGDTDLMEGGDGNDYIDGGDSVDEIFAGNGNDWMRGGVGDDHMNGGSGNDLMEGGGGPVANDGDRYFGDQVLGGVQLPLIEFNGDGTMGNMDIASYENLQTGVTASLQAVNATGSFSNLLDQYTAVDGIVGSSTNDSLTGGSLDAAASNGWNNQIIGGGGDDVITGGGDDGGVIGANAIDATDTNADHYVDWIFGDAAVTRNNLWADLEATQFYTANRAQIEADTANDVDGLGLGTATYDSNDGLSAGTVLRFIGDWGAKHIGIAASGTTVGEMRVEWLDATGNVLEIGHILGEDGAAGTDTAVYRSGAADYTFAAADNGVITVSDTRDVPADPATSNHDGVDKLVGVEELQFTDNTYAVTLGTAGNDRGGAGRLNGSAANDAIFGLSGNDQLVGRGGADILVGGAGNDIVNAGSGADTIIWNAANGGDGRDRVNGGGGTDTFIVNGDAAANESFGIYTRDAFVTANPSINVRANTEIVVTRDGSVIAELRSIEELAFNGYGASGSLTNGAIVQNDTFTIVGNFTGTSLAYNTIHIDGADGDDTVDISGLESDHRIVFEGGGGVNHVIGAMRSQDVVENATYMDDANVDDDEADDVDTGDSTNSGSGGEAVVPTAVPVSGEIPQLGDGNDNYIGTDGADSVFADSGDDRIWGKDGNDMLFGDAGEDQLFAGAGNDIVDGGADRDIIDGGEGDDILTGGSGRDTVLGGSGNDTFIATEGDGELDLYDGGEGTDTLNLTNITSDATIDLRTGELNSVDTGTDALANIENVVGGLGEDTIIANQFVNVLEGGFGDDAFVFKTAADADGDKINDFKPGDKIDLTAIDADVASAVNDGFTLQAGQTLNAAGDIVVRHETDQDGVEHTIIEGNTNDDGNPDFSIDLKGNHNLTNDDFLGVS